MIFDTAQAALDHAATVPHLFDGLDVLPDGRVFLRLDYSVLPPGEDKPDPQVPPEGATPLHRLELPAHIARVENQLTAILLDDGSPKWHPMDPFWVKTIARAYFWDSPEIIYRVGRRGGKSSTMGRVIAAEVAYGDHKDSGATVLVFAIVSQNRGESKDRIAEIHQIFDDCNVPHEHSAEVLRLPELNRAIRVYTASKDGVSGFTAIGVLADEVSKWRDNDSLANPCADVLRSVRPTMATQPNAKLWIVSSPWSAEDPHTQLFEDAIEQGRPAFWAATWVSNPTVPRERALALAAGDLQAFTTEYEAIPLAAAETDFFPADIVNAATRRELPGGDTVGAGGDLGFTRNSSALVICDGGEFGFRVLVDREWVPGKESLRPSKVIGDMIADMGTHGAETLCADIHYVETLREHLEDAEFVLMQFPSEPHRRAAAYLRVRALMAHGHIDLSGASEKLVKQIKQTKMKPTSTTLQITHPTIGGAHGDLASAFVAAVWSLETTPGGAAQGGARRFDHSLTEVWHDVAPADHDVPAPEGAWWAH